MSFVPLFEKKYPFSSAGEGSGHAETSPQKRKEVFEKDSEPQEKKMFSMSMAAKTQAKMGISMNIGMKKTGVKSKGETKKEISMSVKGSSTKPAPIKMALSSQAKETPVAVKPKCDKVASVFNEDSEDEEEMPPEAKMKMRNMGRDTPTAAGPNSFGKNSLGFCDRNRIIEREIQQKILEMSDDK